MRPHTSSCAIPILNAAGFFKPTLIGTNGPVPFRKPTYNRNQFGGNFGGPIIHNKLFFFLDYEGFREVTKPLFVLTLPTQNELNGILVVPVRNPITECRLSRQNTTAIPTGAINPLSRDSNGQRLQVHQRRCRWLPVAPPMDNANGQNANDYSVQIPFRDYSDKGDLRLDYALNSAVAVLPSR